ncbi:uncharacterized protein LOC125496494 [Beta vulgaris subsp. vulgaris]|uniref:uncharacterized protein LOC125496494 n=1 Tax=Beta vulgaris subsp. vulgaris TaxID=3555 RepID=UPI002036CDD3|nr:uncharacterized protein LOC125496494 [Beta vulgaris subsp. vulgaris]
MEFTGTRVFDIEEFKKNFSEKMDEISKQLTERLCEDIGRIVDRALAPIKREIKMIKEELKEEALEEKEFSVEQIQQEDEIPASRQEKSTRRISGEEGSSPFDGYKAVGSASVVLGGRKRKLFEKGGAECSGSGGGPGSLAGGARGGKSGDLSPDKFRGSRSCGGEGVATRLCHGGGCFKEHRLGKSNTLEIGGKCSEIKGDSANKFIGGDRGGFCGGILGGKASMIVGRPTLWFERAGGSGLGLVATRGGEGCHGGPHSIAPNYSEGGGSYDISFSGVACDFSKIGNVGTGGGFGGAKGGGSEILANKLFERGGVGPARGSGSGSAPNNFVGGPSRIIGGSGGGVAKANTGDIAGRRILQ